MTALQQIRRIAEIEFAPLISAVQPLSSKLRLFIRDGSFVDIWVALQIPNRFGFHPEREVVGQDHGSHVDRHDHDSTVSTEDRDKANHEKRRCGNFLGKELTEVEGA